MKTQFTQEQIHEVMEKRGGTRKAALRWLNRNATKQPIRMVNHLTPGTLDRCRGTQGRRA
jgi:ribosomal protein S11